MISACSIMSIYVLARTFEPRGFLVPWTITNRTVKASARRGDPYHLPFCTVIFGKKIRDPYYIGYVVKPHKITGTAVLWRGEE